VAAVLPDPGTFWSHIFAASVVLLFLVVVWLGDE